MEKNRFYTVMVVGKNPQELMEKYSMEKKVEPYIKYKYLDAKKLRDKTLATYKDLISNFQKYGFNNDFLEVIKEKHKAIQSMSPFEYYTLITYGMFYDEDGNAMSEENPDGKWLKYHIGQGFSYPLRLNDGTESYSALKSDIKWDDLHLNSASVSLFRTVWRLVMEDENPTNDDEEKIKKIWSVRKNYLQKFKSEDAFVYHNCSYWNYAYLDDKGWVDLDDSPSDIEWVSTFYDRFVTKLKDDDLITIYEYMVE